MPGPMIELEVRAGTAWITLNRPESLNAWTGPLADDLVAILDQCAADPDVRALVLTGAGKAFSSGADLKQNKSTGSSDPGAVVAAVVRDHYNPMILKLREIPKPVIAAVNGVAAGLGASVALACDLVICSEHAYFLLAFTKVGLTMDGGCAPFVIAKAGAGRAAEMAMLAGRLPAQQGLEWGLVNRVVAHTDLLPTAAEISDRLASGPPQSFAAAKRQINYGAYQNLKETLDLEATLQGKLAASEDFAEGVRAFRDRRTPIFRGR